MAGQAEIRALTGLRGAAACWVMLYHLFQGLPVPGAARTVLLHGYLAVDLFFVLSGYVMAANYAGAFARGFSRAAYLDFLLRRLGRLYPLYALVTLAFAALAGAAWEAPSGWPLAANLLLIQAWGFADSIGGPTWSISTEFAAYLLFPALVGALLRGPRGAAWAAFAAAFAALALIAARGSAELNQGWDDRNGPLDVHGPGTLYPLLRCLAGFALGLLAFRAGRSAPTRRVLGAAWAGDLLAASAAGLTAVPGSDLAEVMLLPPLVLALAAERSMAARLLRLRAIRWLGLVSYSIYLDHRLVNDLIGKPLVAAAARLGAPHGSGAASACLVLAVLAAAALTFRLIERPARAWSRRVAPRELFAAPRVEPPTTERVRS